MGSAVPSKEDVQKITEKSLCKSVQKIERFNTGNHHFVYDVILEGGEKVVARIAAAKEKKALEGALFWSEFLKPKNVPLPEILYSDLSCKKFTYPFVILQRLPGTDLGHIYNDLSVSQRKKIVLNLIDIQDCLADMPLGKGFGYVDVLNGVFPFESWESLIHSSIMRTEDRIAQDNYFGIKNIKVLRNMMQNFSNYLSAVEPAAFLHDMTSKNVLIENGELTGIVDVDSLCFGDPLYLPGLIQAAFIADNLPYDYIGYWKEALNLTDEQSRIVDFYGAQCLCYIMGEIGLKLNKEEKTSPETKELMRLKEALSQLFEKLNS